MCAFIFIATLRFTLSSAHDTSEFYSKMEFYQHNQTLMRSTIQYLHRENSVIKKTKKNKQIHERCVCNAFTSECGARAPAHTRSQISRKSMAIFSEPHKNSKCCTTFTWQWHGVGMLSSLFARIDYYCQFNTFTRPVSFGVAQPPPSNRHFSVCDNWNGVYAGQVHLFCCQSDIIAFDDRRK